MQNPWILNLSPAVAGGVGLEGICIIAEPCGATEVIDFGVLFLGTVATIDTYNYFSQRGPGNGADSGVLAQAQEMVASGIAKTLCEALQILYDSTPSGPQRNKIKAALKAKGCRGH